MRRPLVLALVIILVPSLAFFSTGKETSGAAEPMPLTPAQTLSPPPGVLTIYVLDVGQGDGQLIVSPDGHTMLIDAGPNGQGTSVVLPFLAEMGISSLDYVMASHYHSDHIGGLDEVMNAIPVNEAVLDRGWYYNTGGSDYSNYVNAAGGMRTTIDDGEVILLGGGVSLECVSVNGNGQVPGPYDNKDSENDYSIGLVLTYGNFQYFTAGDLSGEDTSNYRDIETSVAPEVGEVEVYNVNHHGSRHSSNAYFVNTLSPTVSVCSCGSDNPYGHPTQNMIDRVTATGSYIYFTELGSGGTPPPGMGRAVSGHVVISTNGGSSFTVMNDTYIMDEETVPPVITSGPDAEPLDTDARITWGTDEPADSVVQYGLTASYGNERSSVDLVSQHKMDLTGLTPNTTYHYRVGSTDLLGNGPTWSADRTFTTFPPIDDEAPAILSGPDAVEVSDTTALISWTIDEPGDARVQYGIGTLDQSETAAAFDTGHNVTLTGLAPNSEYIYRVGSVDASGNGPGWSGLFTFTTDATPDTTGPAISSVTAEPDHNEASVRWVTDELSDSCIEWGLTAGYGSQLNSTGMVNNHLLIPEGLTPNTTYHFRVGSADLSGNVNWSGDGTFTTLDYPDLEPPSFISFPTVTEVGNSFAVIEWTANENHTGTVEFGTSVAYGQTRDFTVEAESQQVNVTGLTPDTDYHFSVVIYDVWGNGPTASSDSTFRTDATPDLSPPIILSGPVANVSANTVTITWETDENSTSMVEYGPTDAYGHSATDLMLVRSHEISLTSLGWEMQYHYRVKSTDANGIGPTESGDFAFTTPVEPDTHPPEVVAGPWANVTNDTASIEWRSDENATGIVEYGQTGGYGQEVLFAAAGTWHRVNLSALNMGATYHFRIESWDGLGNGPGYSDDATFQTPEGPDTDPPTLTLGPLAYPEAEQARIVWETDEPSTFNLQYSAGPALDGEVYGTTLNTSHEAMLTGLEPETFYQYQITAADAENNTMATGVLTFQTSATPDGEPPVIVSVGMEPGTAVWKNVKIEAEATDNEALAWVEFFVDNVSAKRDHYEPYDMMLDPADYADGTRWLTVVARDHAGNEASHELWFSVDSQDLPVVNITSPTDGEDVSAVVTVRGGAWDPDAWDAVEVVELRVDNGEWTAVDGTADWNVTLELPPGSHRVEARAFDGLGYSEVANVTFNVVAGTARPQVGISVQYPGAVSGTVPLSGSAGSASGSVKVEMRIDDGEWTGVGSGETWEYQLDTTALENGEHVVYFRSFDGTRYSDEKAMVITVENVAEDDLGTQGIMLVAVAAAVAAVGILAVVLRKG